MSGSSFAALRQTRRALSLVVTALTLGLVVMQSRAGAAPAGTTLPAFAAALGVVVSLVALVVVWRKEQAAAEAESLERERRQFEMIKLQIELAQRKTKQQGSQGESSRLNGSAG